MHWLICISKTAKHLSGWVFCVSVPGTHMPIYARHVGWQRVVVGNVVLATFLRHYLAMGIVLNCLVFSSISTLGVGGVEIFFLLSNNELFLLVCRYVCRIN